MRRRVILCTRQSLNPSPVFAKVINACGFDLDVSRNAEIDPSSADAVWIQGNPIWFPRVVKSIRRAIPSKRPKLFIWLTEPLPPPAVSGYKPRRMSLREIAKVAVRDVRVTDPYSNARKLLALESEGLIAEIVVSTGARKTWLLEHGVDSTFIPLGYLPGMGSDMGLTRDIDVLFIGTPDDPRHRYCIRYLKRRGVNLTAVGGYDKRGIWGDARNKLVNRAKIFVCLQRQEGELSGARMLLGMANRSMVLSETTYDPTPYVPGTHYVSADLKDFPERIEHYLSHHDERACVAEKGYEFVINQMTMERSLVKMLSLIDSKLPA